MKKVFSVKKYIDYNRKIGTSEEDIQRHVKSWGNYLDGAEVSGKGCECGSMIVYTILCDDDGLTYHVNDNWCVEVDDGE